MVAAEGARGAFFARVRIVRALATRHGLLLVGRLQASYGHAAKDAHARQDVARHVRQIQSEERVQRAHQVGVHAKVVARVDYDDDVRQTDE